MLLAIDGTGSREWRHADGGNSHVARFRQAYRGLKPVLESTHGPSLAGFDVPAIRRATLTLAREGYRRGERVFDLIGFSRGGHIVIQVARALVEQDAFKGARIRYLCLLDAVDRSPQLSWSNEIPGAVERCRHAVRNAATMNRTWMGNTGRIGRTPQYEERRFWASHGAMGGSPATTRSFGGLAGSNTLLTPPVVDAAASQAVWAWIRDEAVAAGVPLPPDA